MDLKSRAFLCTAVALASLGMSVGLSLSIATAASSDGGKASSQQAKRLGERPLADVDFALLSDVQGRINFDTQRAAELAEGNVVAISLGHGFAPERFVVQARHEPCQRSSWWRLVSIDHALTEATFAMRDGFFAGYVRQPELGIEWTLRPIAQGTVIPTLLEEELNQCGVTPDMGPPAEQAGSVAGGGPFCGTCVSNFADIAFFYTTVALEAEELAIEDAGGDPDTAPYTLGAKSQLECAITTTAIENSDLPYSVRPVYVGLVEYDEVIGGEGSYLGLFASNGDGVMDEIHEIRNEFAADNCSLITQNPPGDGAAGIAIVGGAFNVLMRSYLGGTLHAHEFGHNVGMLHAYGDGPPGFKCESSAPGDPCRMPCETITTDSYAWGWRFNGSTRLCWRTVMAYGPGTGILNYSNPEVIYDGFPTGVEIGEPHQANGAELFRDRFPYVSARRCELTEVETDEGRIAAAGGEAFDAFGISVAGDEYRFIGGASLNDTRAIDAGAAYVFMWREADEGDPSDPEDDLPERWEQVSKLMPDFLRRGDRFGEAMAIDDDILVIAAPRASIWETQIDKNDKEIEVEIVQSAGYVTIWEWNSFDETFCMTAFIQPDDLRPFDWYGTSVAIDDGRIVVGCPRRDTDDNFTNNVGAIYTYNYENGIATLSDVVYGDYEQGKMGSSVAINRDIKSQYWRLLGGAPDVNLERGRVTSWTSFTNDTAAWVFLEHIDGTNGSGARFGSSLAMHDLNMAAGAPFASGGVGKVVTRKFDLLTNLWVDPSELEMPGDESESRFGDSLSMSGVRLAIGAPYSDAPFLERIGAVVVYDQYPDDSWNLTDFLRPTGLRAGDELGHSVSLKGNLAFAGAPDADDDGILSGVVYALEVELEDCNDNGIDDAIDIFLGTEQDLNNNGIPDVCENVGCDADINADGVVDGLDLGLLLQGWNSNGCDDCVGDLNNDGKVNGIDLGLFFAAWGYICDHDIP